MWKDLQSSQTVRLIHWLSTRQWSTKDKKLRLLCQMITSTSSCISVILIHLTVINQLPNQWLLAVHSTVLQRLCWFKPHFVRYSSHSNYLLQQRSQIKIRQTCTKILFCCHVRLYNGSFTLPETDSDTDKISAEPREIFIGLGLCFCVNTFEHYHRTQFHWSLSVVRLGSRCRPLWNGNGSTTCLVVLSSDLDAFNVTATLQYNMGDPDRRGEMKPMDILDFNIATDAFEIPQDACIGKWNRTLPFTVELDKKFW